MTKTYGRFNLNQEEDFKQPRSYESCSDCDCYDPDMGCTMPSIDKSYACPLESEKEEIEERLISRFSIDFHGCLELSSVFCFSESDFNSFIEFMTLNDFDKYVKDFISDWFLERGYNFLDYIDFNTIFSVTKIPVKRDNK